MKEGRRKKETFLLHSMATAREQEEIPKERERERERGEDDFNN